MLSALLMLRRLRRALRYAVREEQFVPVLYAGALLVALGTSAYALGEGWNVVDAFYFAVATLTTSSVGDPDLVLDSAGMKLFTVLYTLTGIGVLVEIARRVGTAFVEVSREDRARGRGHGQHS